MNVTKTLQRLLVAAVLSLIPTACFAAYFDFVDVAPPALPVYAQPPCPAQGYLWTPGYWAHGSAGYYWVPGVWVQPPRAGLLWTPGYWGVAGRVYVWHTGYWGSRVGFYGGVNYGFGYTGTGFHGGVWTGNIFRYNTAAANVNAALIHNTYADRTVAGSPAVRRASFNGPGGADVFPTAAEMAASRELRFRPTAAQLQHAQSASLDPSQLVSFNRGFPITIAMDSIGGQGFDSQGRIAALAGQLASIRTASLSAR